ncbi:Putative ribonuclease H protein At1g65750 [Linum perenne]
MQTAFLPVSLCDKIDRKIRNFIWGSSEGNRRIHNVNWETACRPKNLGGLGLRNARDLNKAFLMKLVWSLVSCPEELWAKVLITKYMTRTENGYMLARKKGFSNAWSGIMKVWDHAHNGIHWSVRDGRNTKFWTDRWIDSGVVLIDHAISLQGVNSSLSVSNFCLNDYWDLQKLRCVLHENFVLQVYGMTPPRADSGSDCRVWGLEDDGVFSVKSTYCMLREIDDGDSRSNWSRIWKWEGPNKIRHFLWLLKHEKLMTNVERGRQRLTDNMECVHCSGVNEDLNHVFRDCDFASRTWIRVLPQALQGDMRNLDFKDWWASGINDPELKSRQWDISVEHIYREANFAADYLANSGHELDLGTAIIFSFPCNSLLKWLRYDFLGVSLPHFINNTR